MSKISLILSICTTELKQKARKGVKSRQLTNQKFKATIRKLIVALKKFKSKRRIGCYTIMKSSYRQLFRCFSVTMPPPNYENRRRTVGRSSALSGDKIHRHWRQSSPPLATIFIAEGDEINDHRGQ